jgi:hypothetical protein
VNIDDKIRAVREAQEKLETACENCDPDSELIRLGRDALAAAFAPDLITEIERLRARRRDSLADGVRRAAKVVRKDKKNGGLNSHLFGDWLNEFADRIASGEEGT